MAYQTTIEVNFGDVDPARIVYYPNIFHFCHIAFERFFAEYVGIAYADLISSENLGFPTVNVTANFEHKIRYGEQILLSLVVTRIGRRSVDFQYQGFRRADGVRYFQATITVVAVRMDSFQSVELPARYAEIFASCQS